MLSAPLIISTVLLSLGLIAGTAAQGQTDAHEDLAPCPGSAPEPAQSSAWGVSFCNRTGHDIVLEFHDNDCPIQDWRRRGDVYRKSLRRGESATFPLCYVNEPPAATAKPGFPTLRIPGGKGVVTTWNVAGDCGARSDRLNLDARSFYDRGDYKTGIILLQFPEGAAHCVADSSSPSRPQAQAPAEERTPVRAAPPVAAQPQSSAPAPSNGMPSFEVAKDSEDIFGRTVHVFATTQSGEPSYRCRITLQLDFSDGSEFVDRPQTQVSGGQTRSPVLTRKYGKTVAKVVLSSSQCSAQ